MSRNDDAIIRGKLRWEFVRRNSEYIKEYELNEKNHKAFFERHLFYKKTTDHFLKKFHVYPLNPRYSFNQLLQEMHRLECLSKSPKEKKLESILGFVGPKKKYIITMRKIEPLERKERKNGISKQNEHSFFSAGSGAIVLGAAINHLCGIRLGSNKSLLEDTVIKGSYLTQNNNIRRSLEGGLEDVSVKISIENINDIFKAMSSNLEINGSINNKTNFKTNSEDKYLDHYVGDLSHITIELDLSFPTKEIIEDLKKEISGWKQVKRKYSKIRENRQRFNVDYVRELLEVYDLRIKPTTYKVIAKEVFGRETFDAIQKTRNLFNKAKKYIDGDYKQIR